MSMRPTGRLTPRRMRAAAPDHHAIARAGQAEPQLVPGDGEDAAQPRLAQEARVAEHQPPGDLSGGRGFGEGRAQRPGPTVLNVSAAPTVPVTAPSVLRHCTKGASVT